MLVTNQTIIKHNASILIQNPTDHAENRLSSSCKLSASLFRHGPSFDIHDIPIDMHSIRR